MLETADDIVACALIECVITQCHGFMQPCHSSLEITPIILIVLVFWLPLRRFFDRVFEIDMSGAQVNECHHFRPIEILIHMLILLSARVDSSPD